MPTPQPPYASVEVESVDLVVVRFVGTFTPGDLEREFDKVASVVRQEGASWRMLTDVREMRLSGRRGDRMLTEFSRANRPYVSRGAVLGISGLRRFIFDLVVSLSRRGESLQRFDDEKLAREWLEADAIGA